MSHECLDAMKIEIDVIENNKTRELTELPCGKKAIGLKWVLKTKLNSDEIVFKYKVRLVV